MPSRILPDSVPSILRCLTAAQDKYAGTAAPDRALSVAQMALISGGPTSYLVRLNAADQALRLALAAQAPLTADLAVQAARARMFVSHFHQVLDLGIARGKFAAGARSFYGRDVHATSIPNLDTYQSLAEAVLNVGTGESARATAEGGSHVPMALPSASEVEDAVQPFMDGRTSSATAQSHTNAKQEAVQALLPEGLALTVDVYDTVEFFYRKDTDAASRRDKCREWGVVYTYGAGEVPPVPEQADITDITTPGPGQVHFHYDALNAVMFDVFHKPPLAAVFLKVAEDVEAKVYQVSGLVVGAHEFKVLGRNDAGDGPESAVAVVQVN